MRAVFFVQGERVPAARARGIAVAQALEARGISCSVRIARPSVYGDTRLPWPLDRPRALYLPVAALARLPQLRDLRDDDVVIFQRPMTELPTTFLERRAARGHKTVFDFDDAIFERVTVRAKFHRLVGLVDRVVAGNRYLAAAARAPEKTVVIPTAVDTERFALQPTRASAGARRGGGLDRPFQQLPPARARGARHRPRARADGARFLAISDRPPPPGLRALGAEFVRWRPETRGRGSGPHRHRGHAAARRSVRAGQMRLQAASIHGARPSRRGLAGGRQQRRRHRRAPTDSCPTTRTGGTRCSRRLIQDPVLRQDMGTRARATIERGYSLAVVADKYKSVLTDLARL